MTKLVVRPAQSAEISAMGLDGLHTKPGFKPAMCRVGVLDDGQVVSRLMTEHHTLRYGHARIRVVGVSNVYTELKYRRKGFAAALIHDALAYMMEQGAHLALLNDPSGYFGRFGFSPVWPYYSLEFASSQAAALPSPLALRPPNYEDIPQMAHLYERQWAGRVTFNRTPEMWVWRVSREAGWQIVVAVDDRGQVRGYIAGRDWLNREIEIIADTLEAASTLIAESGRLHRDAGHTTVRWYIPPDDSLIGYAQRLLDVTLSAEYRLDGGWTARLINMPGLVETLLPEVITQAGISMPGFDAAALTVDCVTGGVKIGLRGHKTAQCYLNQRDFIQVIFGSLRPAALASRLHPDATQLLQALFPPRMAALGCWDWF